MLDQASLDVYRYAVSHPGWTPEEASEALGYTSRVIEAAVEALESRYLLVPRSTTGRSYAAVSPDIALSELVGPDERALLDLRQRVNARRRELATLLPAFLDAHRLVPTGHSVEVLEKGEQVQRAIDEYGRAAVEQVLIARPGHGANADVHEQSIQKDQDLLARGVKRRTLYHSSTRDHVPTRKAVETIHALGGEFRTLPFVPLRAFVFDQKVAVAARQLSPTDRAGLVIRDPDLVRVFILLFDFAWELADPYLTEERTNAGLTSTQRSVLNGLAAGYSDEVIARRVGISVRTCRRHIAWMLDELGAESRFQAGVKAQQAGWF